MQTITIKIKANKSGHLILTDSEGHTGEDNITTIANDGDTIVWALEENSGIRALTGISAKEGSQNLFSEGPNRISDSEWRGVVDPNASGSELYFIEYMLENGEQKKDDPKIIIPPK